MAITKIHPISSTLNLALNYIENPAKTDYQLLCTGYMCAPESAAEEFNYVKKIADKQDGYQAFHLIQSFAPNEVEYTEAHKIGIELADKVLKGKYQYVVSTHIDKGHIHNHIIFNSVSIKDYSKYNSSPNSYYLIRRTSDKLCKEHNLSIIEEPKDRGSSYYESSQNKQGKSWKSLLRQDIDKCIITAASWDNFIELMQKHGYDIKFGKHIAFKAKGQERFTRCKTLGNDYTEEAIKNRICGLRAFEVSKDDKISLIVEVNNAINAQRSTSSGFDYWKKINNIKMAAKTLNYLTENKMLDYNVVADRFNELKTAVSNTAEQIKITEAKLKVIEEEIANIDNYRKTKPVADKYAKAVFKDKFSKEHESELIIFKAADKYIKAHFKGNHLPLIKDLRAKQKRLYSEKNKLYESYYSSKSSFSEFQTIKKNLDSILGQETVKEFERKRKQPGELE